MKNVWWIALLVWCMTWGPVTGLAQDEGGNPEVRDGLAPLRLAIPHLGLEPMTLGEVRPILTEILDGKVNFIFKEGVAGLDVPALDLTGTDLLTFLALLQDIVPELRIKVGANAGAIPLDLALVRAPHGLFAMGASAPLAVPSENPIIIFERTRPATPEPRETRTVYVGGLLQAIDLGDIQTAIGTAWDLNPGTSDPTLRFHEDTELLFAVADERQLVVMEEVMEQLNRRGNDLRNKTNADLKERLKVEKERLQAEYRDKRVKMDAHLLATKEGAKKEIAKFKELKEKHEALAAEDVQRLRDELTSAKKHFEAERIRLREKMKAEQSLAALNRGDMLDQMDALKRDLAHERQRKLDEEEAPVEAER